MRRFVRLVALVALVMVGGVIGGTAQAASPHASGQDTFQLAPGGSATITFESFCLDYGKTFPTAVGLPPTQVADQKVVNALSYAQSKGYTASAPKEVQFALWQALGAQGSPAVGTQGTEIVQANGAPAAAAPAGAVSVIDALRDNRIKATAGTWSGIGEKVKIGDEDTNFQGRGDLKIENTSGQQLTLYMPTGTVFPAPSAEFQSMAGYATDIQVSNPQQLPDTGVSDSPLGTIVALGIILGVTMGLLGGIIKRRSHA